jgi:hypothetical protein
MYGLRSKHGQDGCMETKKVIRYESRSQYRRFDTKQLNLKKIPSEMDLRLINMSELYM